MTAIVSKYGELLMFVNGDVDAIKINTPEGCSAVESPPRENMYYTEAGWVDIPPKPGEGFAFDYQVKMWIDARNIMDVRDSKWQLIKEQRDSLEFGGFEYNGNIYDSDQVSQGRIMGATIVGIDQVWTLADNTTVELSATELQQLYAAMQTHIASIHERGRIARLAIESAETKEEVEAIQL